MKKWYWVAGGGLFAVCLLVAWPLIQLGLRADAIRQAGATPIYYQGLLGADLRGPYEQQGNRFDSGAVLRQLQPIHGLRALLLGGVPFSRTDVKLLGQFRELKMLDVSTTSIDDSNLREIRRIETLHSLVLQGCVYLTADGLDHLHGMPRLEFLTLPPLAVGTATNAAVGQLVDSLPALRTIRVHGSGGSDELGALLKSRYPGLRVEYMD